MHNTALQSTRYRVAPFVALRQRPPELGRWASAEFELKESL